MQILATKSQCTNSDTKVDFYYSKLTSHISVSVKYVLRHERDVNSSELEVTWSPMPGIDKSAHSFLISVPVHC